LPSVQLITPDDGHRRCPKHVEFRDKINFGYFMHLVGYFYEAYHDAQSLEHKGILRSFILKQNSMRFEDLRAVNAITMIV
jgi:hypothetical protein